MPALVIQLKRLNNVRGIYGANKNLFPTRAAFLHPAAAAAFEKMEREAGPFDYSDILRGADESLAACKAGKATQPPGYSGHNFGLSFDIAVERVMKEKRWTYPRLCTALTNFGWYPYRQDLSRGSEDWHFNYLGDKADEILKRTSTRNLWQNAAEEAIRVFYPNITPVGAYDIQVALKKLCLYSGDLDGHLGTLSFVAINLFNQQWGIGANAIGERFQRTLAYVASERHYVDSLAVA
jgi:hypothetical protein